MRIVAPSILSADFGNLERDIKMIDHSAAEWVHIDVMDGVFVPNISFGFPVMKPVRKATTKILDVHLMIVNPERYVERFRDAGASIITVHYEACADLKRTIDLIHSCGVKAGVSINPETPTSVLREILPCVDLVLIMSVHPGFGGQKFMEDSLQKICEVKRMISEENLSCLIEVDGGIGLGNVEKVVRAGADAVVAGAAVFSAESPESVIRDMKKL